MDSLIAPSRFTPTQGVSVSIGGNDTLRADPDAELDWAFGLTTLELKLFTRGLARRLPAGPAETLGRRVRDFFQGLDDLCVSDRPVPRLLVGALPFDRQADDMLFLPEQVSNTPWPRETPIANAHGRWRIEPEPSRATYEAAVTRVLEEIRASRASEAPLDKVVLSRSLRVLADQDIDAFGLWTRLRADHSVTRFLTPLGAGPGGAMRRLVGASPELLVSKQGEAVLSHPLAGSARRSVDPSQDEASAKALFASDKDRREHAVVVEAILDSLAPYCRELKAPPGPALVSTRTVWHLGTRIHGVLRHPDETSAAELAAALHPTPAVAGSPRNQALGMIDALEGYDRGFYAGAVGWTNASGDGAWYVSLRCAEVCGPQARLYAGAGVVEGSSSQGEADETSNKFQAVLQALGIDEDGQASSRDQDTSV